MYQEVDVAPDRKLYVILLPGCHLQDIKSFHLLIKVMLKNKLYLHFVFFKS